MRCGDFPTLNPVAWVHGFGLLEFAKEMYGSLG